jgi:hypothetical protein
MQFLDCKETQRPVILEAITLLANAGKLHDIGVRAGIKPVLQELDDACLDSPAVRYCSFERFRNRCSLFFASAVCDTFFYMQ